MEAAEKTMDLLKWLVPLVILAIVVLPSAVRILREYERAVVFRLGKLLRAKGPALVLLIPMVDRMVRMDLRVVTIDVPKQEIMTRDNVSVTVDAVVYFRVVDPVAAVIRVENFLKATSLIAQTTLRSVLGQAELDDLLGRRDKINQTLQEVVDRHTDPWGVKVTAVEVRDVAPPEDMKRTMAKQAESERERRAKVINAEGEYQAAEKPRYCCAGSAPRRSQMAHPYPRPNSTQVRATRPSLARRAPDGAPVRVGGVIAALLVRLDVGGGAGFGNDSPWTSCPQSNCPQPLPARSSSLSTGSGGSSSRARWTGRPRAGSPSCSSSSRLFSRAD